MTDVRILPTDDEGDITVTGGVVALDDGLESSVYLSLFGGNEDDPGGIASSLSWWGNLLEPDTDRHQRSETQHLLIGLPATSGNLLRVKAAAERDLGWMLRAGIASAVTVDISIPTKGRVRIAPSITVEDRTYRYAFTKSWQGRTA